MFEAEEEKNAEGFAKECAIVTLQIKNDPDKPGKLMVDPNAKLERRINVRPYKVKLLFGLLIKDG
jgi:prolyl-tRNA synthetase